MVRPRDTSNTTEPEAEDLRQELSEDPALDAGIVAAFSVERDTPPLHPIEKPTDSWHAENSSGKIICGKYKLLECIGEGGMGSVWMAEQREPVKRKVALKLIKKGMDSKAVLARFDAERQALAIMDHPNIAKILDGGLTDAGLPFFVMELVRGFPITKYCDEKRLTPRERLELFVPVCQAIQHAHQKGIIHRDIKPSNVLVAMYDDHPVPKVIDFGIAKATGHQSLTDMSLNTGFGDVVGTLEYMSPEQASLNNLDVDTRSDVFSLGVLLYELLAGSPPFRRDDLAKAGLLEILRVIREEPPPKPSTKLSSAAHSASLAANRNTEPNKLTGMLRKELDWIVLKALEKDRSRRYETPSAFAADIARYLAGQAVTAHPPSTVYLMKMFVRRHHRGILATSILILALLAGVIGISIGMIEAQRQRDAARTAKLESDVRLTVIEKGNELLSSIFSDLNLHEVEAQDKPLFEILGERLTLASSQLDTKAIGDPLSVARMQVRIGDALRGLDHTAESRTILEKAGKFLNANLGVDHEESMRCQYYITLAIIAESENGYYQAKERFADLYERQSRILGATHPHTLDSMGDLGAAYMFTGQLDKAISLMEDNVRLYRENAKADDLDLASSEQNLGVAYLHAGEFVKCRKLLEMVLERRKNQYGAGHYQTLVVAGNLAHCLMDMKDWDSAKILLLESEQLASKNLGSDHRQSIALAAALGSLLHGIGDLERSLEIRRQTYERCLRRFGANHQLTMDAKFSLADVYEAKGLYEQAFPIFQSHLIAVEQRHGTKHPVSLGAANRVAKCHMNLGQYDQAVAVLERIVQQSKELLGEDHPSSIIYLGQLGLAYHYINRNPEARDLLQKAIELGTVKLGRASALISVNNLALVYASMGDHQSALPLHEECLTHFRRTLGNDHPNTLTALENVASAYSELKHFDKGIPLLEEALKLKRAKLGDEHPETHNTLRKLAAYYLRSGTNAKFAIPLCEELITRTEGKFGRKHDETQKCVSLQVDVFQAVGMFQQAVNLRREQVALSTEQFGTDHDKTIHRELLLAGSLSGAGDNDASIQLLRDLVVKREKKHGKTHIDTIATLSFLARGLQHSAAPAEALDVYQEILRRLDANPTGELSESLRPLIDRTQIWFGAAIPVGRAFVKANQLEKMHDLLKKERERTSFEDRTQRNSYCALVRHCIEESVTEQQFETAEQLHREIVAIVENYSPDSWSLYRDRSFLGEILLKRKNFSEALPLLVGGYEGLVRVGAPTPKVLLANLQRAVSRLIEYYEQTDDPTQLAKWKSELEKLNATPPPEPTQGSNRALDSTNVAKPPNE